MKPIFGSDPEFFIKKGTKVISASDIFPGKNDKKILENGSAVFFDGIQAEINTEPSSKIGDILNVVKETLDLVTGYVEENGCQILISPAEAIERDVIRSAPKEASMFGCDVDFDAYTCKPNPTHSNVRNHPYRYAGGHIHFGISHINELHDLIFYDMEVVDFIKLLDVIVGIPCVLLDRNGKNTIRRKMYGKAGCFRTTDYGIEYRTLSNFWLKSPVLTDIVHRLSRIALRIAVSDKTFISNTLWPFPIQRVINSNNLKHATIIYKIIRKNLMAASLDKDPFYNEDKRLILAFEYIVINRVFERASYKKQWETIDTIDSFYDKLIETDASFREKVESGKFYVE